MPKIQIKDLCASYTLNKESVTAIDGLNVDFADGGINVIVGYSGCGKSTLLKCILGLVPYYGEILVNGEDIYAVPPQKRGFAFVSQEFSLYPHMTVFDNIASPLKIMGAKRAEVIPRVTELAQSLGVTACLTRKPKHISLGQQQRVAIARALVKNPSLVLMDEPLSNLDAQTRVAMRKMLKDVLKRSGATVIYVTHDFNEAMILADRLIVMDGGRVVKSGEPNAVFDSGDEVVNALKSATEYK